MNVLVYTSKKRQHTEKKKKTRILQIAERLQIILG